MVKFRFSVKVCFHISIAYRTIETCSNIFLIETIVFVFKLFVFLFTVNCPMTDADFPDIGYCFRVTVNKQKKENFMDSDLIYLAITNYLKPI